MAPDIENRKMSRKTDPPPVDDPLKGRKKRQISVIERRLKGDPFVRQQGPVIQLKDQSMRIRWFNGEISHDKIFVAEHEKGWIKVHKDDVANPEQLGAFTITPEGWITRGQRGQEMCMMMPKAAAEAVQAAKEARNIAGMQSQTKQREKLQAAVAAFGLGDEFVDKTKSVEIHDFKGPSG